MSTNFTIRREAPNDIPAIGEVHIDAFGSNEPISELVASLRNLSAPLPTVSLVAVDEARIIGHVMLSHAWLDAPKTMVDVMVLSPLGVRTAFKGQGIGTALIKQALAEAGGLNVPLVFLEGNPKYYGPCGFLAAEPMGFRRPSLRIPKPAFQVVKLAGYSLEMNGTLVYRDLFWEMDCVGLRK